MFCSYCRQFDKSGKRNVFREDGCTSFRKEVVKSHAKSDLHILSANAHTNSLLKTTEKAIEKSLIKLSEAEIEKMKKKLYNGCFNCSIWKAVF